MCMFLKCTVANFDNRASESVVFNSAFFRHKGSHTASKWTFTQKKRNSNFEHRARNFMPSGSQNMIWINPGCLSEREIAI